MKKQIGKIHPIQETFRELSKIFVDMGFEIADGPLIEDQWHNFDALNIPKDHPARDMQDTFFIKGSDDVLRTHTSSVQIRFMEKFMKEGKELPLKIIAPGKVFRSEATDNTHEIQFHQLEGLLVGEGINFGHLKFTMTHFIKSIVGEDVILRFRPGFFPFVEPGIEIDVKIHGREDWLEIIPGGMVHPNVLKNVGIDPKKYSGFAFGLGVDRLTMMKYGIDDIRNFYNGDLRLHNNLK